MQQHNSNFAENEKPCKGILSKGPGLTRGDQIFQDLLESAYFFFQDLLACVTV